MNIFIFLLYLCFIWVLFLKFGSKIFNFLRLMHKTYRETTATYLPFLFTSLCASSGFFHNKVTAVSDTVLVMCIRTSLNTSVFVCVLRTCLCNYVTSWLQIMIRDMNQLNGFLLGMVWHLYSNPCDTASLLPCYIRWVWIVAKHIGLLFRLSILINSLCFCIGHPVVFC